MKIKYQLNALLMLTPLLFCTGCLGPMVHAVNSGHPTLTEMEKLWPPIPGDKGRLIVFMQRSIGKEILIGLPSSGFRVNDKYNEVLGGTFLWSDLPVGEHTIRVGGMLFASKDNVPFTIKPGETTFIELEGKQAPKVLNREAALVAMAKV